MYPNDKVAKAAISCELLSNVYYTDRAYNNGLHHKLSAAISEFQPDIIFYNAGTIQKHRLLVLLADILISHLIGTDCLINDPLGRMELTEEAVIQRDEIVFRLALERERQPIPIVMVLSGGYQQNNAPLIARSILNLDNKFGLLRSSEQQQM